VTRLFLVRHGKAAAVWGESADPGLDDVGHRQAEAIAAHLGPVGPLPIVVSPLQRTRQTAAAIERMWHACARVEPRIGEIPAPDAGGAGRATWLKAVMQRRWSELDLPLQAWREEVLNALYELAVDTVVVSHFIALNVAVGHALDDDRLVVFRPDHCSCTLIKICARRFQLLELGAQGATRVL
jgi:broad specificity phosphatase PhoE